MSTRSSQRRRRHTGGFTLLEVLIAVGLLAVVGGVVVRSIRVATRSDVRQAAGKIGGAVKYLFDRASTTGKIHRLVFDLDSGRYWAEVSDDKFLLPREKETEESRAAELEKRAREDEEEKRKQEESARSSNDRYAPNPEKYQPSEWKPKRARFQPVKESTARPVKLSRVKVAGVWSPRSADLVREGKAYVYFFPLGFTEAAWLHVTNEKGEGGYTVAVHPLTGRTRVWDQIVEPPFDRIADDSGELLEDRR